MTEIKSFRDLEVWQLSVEMSVRIYQITAKFPDTEMNGLTNQIRIASVSVASNIAEGHSRSSKDYVRFLSISRGSLSELETQLEIARRIEYLNNDDYIQISDDLNLIGKKLNTLIGRLRSHSNP